MVINTHVPPRPRRISLSSQDIVLVVIGTSGCGKSTVIRKGLSSYGLSESNVVPEDPQAGTPQFIQRSCSVAVDPDSPDGPSHAIQVIEVEAETKDGRLQWPHGLPPMDGVIICYDSSNKNSFQPVEGLLKRYRSMILPIMVLGCKADLTKEVKPGDAVAMLKQYDTGLIEVSSMHDSGKGKMKQSFTYLLKAVLRQRGPNRTIDDRNPASPALTQGEDKENSWTHTPVDSPLIPTHVPSSLAFGVLSGDDDATTPNQRTSASPPLSPVDQTRDPLPELDIPVSRADNQDSHFVDSEEIHLDSETSPGVPDDGIHQVLEESKNGVKKEPRPTQWAHLDELLDKLLFLAVSGDDPTYGTHFLLTYRRFATPRSVLLAMQKRMRQLDNPSGDPMFACFAQMRICHLLETWIRNFPHDFAVKGTVGALNALIKSIISKTHLLHYGSEFLPFLEELPTLVDLDTAWALKADISDNDSDDYNEEEDDDDETRVNHEDRESFDASSSTHMSVNFTKVSFPSRERKSSLPLPKALLSPQTSGPSLSQDYSPRQHIRDLVKLAQDVQGTEADEIAQEITRSNVKKFLEIKPRDWLHYSFVSGRKGDTEPITAFNTSSNHLADWVVSLILCHDRPRHRARQMEKLVEIAQKLRQLNNYSALRAFVAGINIAADETTMEVFKSRTPDAAKNLMSWDVLLQQIRSHRAYRLALRNSKGACIPALEVHMSDLIKAHEGNGDINEADPTKIHWGKFNMMGRFITNILQCQAQCRNSNDYDFPERPNIAELFIRRPVMSIEMQKSRLKSSDVDYDGPRGGLRELFFW